MFLTRIWLALVHLGLSHLIAIDRRLLNAARLLLVLLETSKFLDNVIFFKFSAHLEIHDAKILKRLRIK